MASEIRTDIQALRGLAIVLVLLYHAETGLFPGGFLGVDIFFVISGFLITGLVKKGVESGNFRFSDFYFRRAKRLLPAAYVTFFASALAAPFVLNAQESQDLTEQVFGALSFTANVVLLFQSGYFSSAAELKPLLHVWSLSIEEQYYLLLPAFLVFVPRKYWISGSIALLLTSLGLCLALLTVKPIATFYLLPMRGWELGIGSLAAILTVQAQRVSRMFVVMFWPAVVMLLWVPLAPTGLPHPGLDAILVCLATVIVILRRHPFLDTSRVSRALARVGDVSYSLYLAHWPPFAFLKNAAVGPITLWENLATLALGIVLALLLYRYVELPSRRLQLRPTRRLLLAGVATSLGVLGIPVVIASTSVAGPDYAYIRRSNDGFAAVCAFETNFTPRAECRNSNQPTVMVWGDSYAMHLVPGIVASTNKGVVQATRGNCGPFANLAPLSNVYYLRPWAEACLDFNRSVLDYLQQTPSIKTVVLSSPFHQYLRKEYGKHHWRSLSIVDETLVEQDVSEELAATAMVTTIRQLRTLGKNVLLVAPPPSSGFNTGACLERKAQGKLVIGAPTGDCSIPQADYQRFFALTQAFLRRVQKETGIRVISFDSVLCDSMRCVTQLDGKLLYVDSGHLTHDASLLLFQKLGFGEIFNKELQ